LSGVEAYCGLARRNPASAPSRKGETCAKVTLWIEAAPAKKKPPRRPREAEALPSRSFQL